MVGGPSPFLNAASAALAFTRHREETIVRLGLAVGAYEARRAIELAERVGLAEGRASPVVLTSERVEQYVAAIVAMAMRGEPLPKDEDAMRGIPEAVTWRALDYAAILGLR